MSAPPAQRALSTRQRANRKAAARRRARGAAQAMRWEREVEERNRPLSDEELDAMLPAGYRVLEPPAGYQPINTPARKLMATPTPLGGTPLYGIPEEERGQKFDVPVELEGLPELKPEDHQYFGKLLKEVEDEELSVEELKERKIMKLLLKVKNGTPPQRKAALRQLTDKARDFGAGPLFNQILPLLMSPTLEDQERHLLVKVIDRILYKLDELVRPFVHKILVVIEPLLIDEDYYARVEGREIIANLSKAAGLATMIAAMRPDIDNIDECAPAPRGQRAVPCLRAQRARPAWCTHLERARMRTWTPAAGQARAAAQPPANRAQRTVCCAP
jgi:splicing factor 3B subunit 1